MSCPTSASSARFRAPGRVTALDRVLAIAHWAWFIEPHLALVWILVRRNDRFARGRAPDGRRLRPRLRDLLRRADGAALVGGRAGGDGRGARWSRCRLDRARAPARPPGHGRGRRGHWGRAWPRLYSRSGGNPWAAMPSLHFATSLLAAILLAEAGPLAGAVGWGYAVTLGFALVYLGEHYVIDLVAGAALVGARAARRAARRAAVALRSAMGFSAWSASLIPDTASVRQPLTRLQVLAGMGSDPGGGRSGLVEDEDQIEDLVEDEDQNEEPSFFADPQADRADARRGAAPRRRDLRPAAEARRHPGRGREARRRQPIWIAVALAFYVLDVRLLRGAVPRRRRRARPAPRMARVLPDHDGRAGGDAAVLGRRRGRHRAHLLGASQGRACRGARPRAGWSPSSSSSTPSTWWRWSSSAILLAHRGAQRRQPGRPDDRPGRDRRRRDRRLPADRA